MNVGNTVTSFKKKGVDAINIPGTRISPQNAQLLTSTGSPTLDFFIGGGLAVGTICLIEEDRYNSFCHLLFKYFLVEGIAHHHYLFLASSDKDPKILLKELPAIKSNEPSTNTMPIDSDKEDLKIAWRYKNMSVSHTPRTDSHAGFDLTKPISDEALQQSSVSTCNIIDGKTDETNCQFLKKSYAHVYTKIKNEIEKKSLKTTSKIQENILRIGISSIGSPLWHSSTDSETEELNLVKFFYSLKSLLRTSFAVAVVTLPFYIHQNKVMIGRLKQVCDTVIGLESFVGSDRKSNPLFRDFDGLLHIRKLPVLNSFLYPTLTSDLAFKLKKRGMLIERLHLPPDFEEPPSEQPTSFCCGSQNKCLDF